MDCPKCGAQVSDTSKFCRYCANPLQDYVKQQDSGYTPSVPPPGQTDYAKASSTTRYTQAPLPPAVVHTAHCLVCPRCGSANVLKGGIPVWAIVLAIVLAFVICILSLFFLLAREPNRCLACGYEFK